MNRHLHAAVAAALLGAAPLAAHAAQSYDNCTGFIDSLPATISTQGTWCLRKDLNTAQTGGNAINIYANNVTIDCNDFKIGGLAAGPNTYAVAISAFQRQNVTVRQCTVRGFMTGVNVLGGDGHLVEDNRFDNNTFMGIYVDGDSSSSVVRDNRVHDTGGYPSNAYGIVVTGDALENLVDGVFASGASTYPVGIQILSGGGEVRGNRVRGLAVSGSGEATGIQAQAFGISLRDNHVVSMSPIAGKGIRGHVDALCSGNTIAGFSTAIDVCRDTGGNP